MDDVLSNLRLGRGTGFLQALECDRALACSYLLNCITQDPRLGTFGSRIDYYTNLALSLNFDLCDLENHLQQKNEVEETYNSVGLTLETMGELAKRGRQDALFALHNYLRDGIFWQDTIVILVSIRIPQAVKGLDEILKERFPNDDDLETELTIERDPAYANSWSVMAQSNPRLARFILKTPSELQPDLGLKYYCKEVGQYYSVMKVSELLDHVSKDNFEEIGKVIPKNVKLRDLDILMEKAQGTNPSAVYAAFMGLEVLKQPFSIPVVKNFLETITSTSSSDARSAAIRTFQAIPADSTLDLARAWFHSSNEDLRIAAEGVLAKHGTNEDLPMIRQDIDRKLKNGEIRGLHRMLKILVHFPPIGFLPEIEQVFLTASDSLARTMAAEIMWVTAPDHFSNDYAYECLWDCEADTRYMGCVAVSLGKVETRERLQTLEEDKFESIKVRTGAREKLDAIQ